MQKHDEDLSRTHVNHESVFQEQPYKKGWKLSLVQSFAGSEQRHDFLFQFCAVKVAPSRGPLVQVFAGGGR